MAYVDASVLAAYYCPEPLSRTAQREVRKRGAPVISPLTEVEFCSALAIKTRTGEMEADSARRILAQFRAHCAESRYRIVSVEAREYSVACDWIAGFSSPLRTVDALHLAAVFTNGLVLVTADKGLAKSARHFGVKHKLVS
jgi:predicted nucleic acid-binding protein